MRFMNEYDIDDAVRQWARHPVLGPAALTIRNLRDWTNRNSDGWVYWQKPSNAAGKLQDLIMDPGTAAFGRDFDREDATPEQLKAALRPIKAFRTRMTNEGKITETNTFEIVEVLPAIETLDHVDSLDLDEAREALAANNCGDPVGYRVLRGSAETCLRGCMAPGSSPHSHPPIVGYFLIGTTGYVQVNNDGVPMACGTLRPL